MSDESGELTPESLRQAFGHFPSGVTAIAGLRDGIPTGMAASSFTSVSLDPPLASICFARTSTTWPTLRTLPRLGLSVLAEEQEPVARALAAKGIDRFAEFDWNQTDDGAVLVQGAALWIETELVEELPAGDHEIALLSIRRIWSFPGVEPLVFHSSRYRQLRGATEGSSS